MTNSKKKSALFFLPLLLLVLSGCMPLHRGKESQRITVVDGNVVDLSDSTQVKKILYHQLNEWKGVQYRSGGLSKDGIDCSGFVYITFLSRFGIKIPRSTRYQAGTGYGVPKSKLQAGDLVFFKTGFKSHHVGIYVEEKQFIHASKSSGVMMSRLDDDYWFKRYWRAVRIAL